MKKIAVLLSGSGVYDGTEIQEAVFTLLSIAENDGTYVCFAPDIEQHHVVNHLSGAEMNEKRNALTEAARIARGDIKNLEEFNPDDFDGLVIPGGFGAAKNLTKWAFEGPAGEILPVVKKSIAGCIMKNKPVAGLCMGPTVIAKALAGTGISAELTVGTTSEKSPYEIQAISEGMNSIGAVSVMKTVREVAVDRKNKIVTAPCYMMEAGITDIRNNVKMAVDELFRLM
jgi:enhancing lycopene biosynthesis protein 2